MIYDLYHKLLPAGTLVKVGQVNVGEDINNIVFPSVDGERTFRRFKTALDDFFVADIKV